MTTNFIRFLDPSAPAPTPAGSANASSQFSSFMKSTATHDIGAGTFVLVGDYQIYDLQQGVVSRVGTSPFSVGSFQFSVSDSNVSGLMSAATTARNFDASVLGFSNGLEGELEISSSIYGDNGTISGVKVSGSSGHGIVHRFEVAFATTTLMEDSSPASVANGPSEDGIGKTVTVLDASRNTATITKQAGAAAVANDSAGGPSQNNLHYFMKVTQAGTTNWVEIDSFAFSIAVPVLTGTATGGGAVRTAQYSTLEIDRTADDASLRFQQLFASEATGGRVDIQAFTNYGTDAAPNWGLAKSFTFATPAVPTGSSFQQGAFVQEASLDTVGADAVKEHLVFRFGELTERTYKFDPATQQPKPEGNAFSWSEVRNGELVSDSSRDLPATDHPELDGSGHVQPVPAFAGDTSPVHYFLEIFVDPGNGEASIRGNAISGPPGAYELAGFNVDLENHQLRVILPGNGETSELTTALYAGTHGKVVLTARTEAGHVVGRITLDAGQVTQIANTVDGAGSGQWIREATFDFDHTVNDTPNGTKLTWMSVTSGSAEETLVIRDVNGNEVATQSNPDAKVGGVGGLTAPSTSLFTEQRVFMRVTASDGQTDWVEIDSFDLTQGLDEGLRINRLSDDASAKLAQLALKDGALTIDLSIWDDNDTAGGPWRQVGQYRFVGADITQLDAGGIGDSGAAGTEQVQITFAGFSEKLFTFATPTSTTFRQASHNAGPNGAVTTDLPPIDQPSGRLDYPADEADPLVDLSDDTSQVFLHVANAGTEIKSGDGILAEHFHAYNDWFAVNQHAITVDEYGIHISITLGNTQNLPGLEALVLTGPNIVLQGVVGRLGSSQSDVQWQIAGRAEWRSEGIDSSGGRTYIVDLATPNLFGSANTVSYGVLDSSDGSSVPSVFAPGGSFTTTMPVSGTFTRNLDGSITTTGLSFTDSDLNGGFGNAWQTQGGTEALYEPDQLRHMMRVAGVWVAIDSYQIEPDLLSKVSPTVSITFNGSAAQAAYDVAKGTVITDLEIETWFVGEQLRGLYEYHFTNAKPIHVEHNGDGSLTLTYQTRQWSEVLQKYAVGPSGDLLPDGNFYYEFEQAPSQGLPNLDRPLGDATNFTALTNPVTVTGGSASRSAPAFGVQSLAGDAEYVSVQQAADEAAAGSTVNVDLGAIDTNVILHTQDLTFNLVAAGVHLDIALDSTNPGGVPINDVTITGLGSSTIVGNAVGNTIQGGDGVDVLNGGLGNDLLYGGEGNDILTDGAGNDDQGVDGLYGQGGDDTIIVEWANGANIYDGGAGNDTLDVSNDGGYSNVILGAAGFVTFGSTFVNFENFKGSANGETVTGTEGDNKIWGNGGADTLNGNGGKDYLDGGTGADALNGGTGDDELVDTDVLGVDDLRGDADNDTIRVTKAISGERFDGGDGVDTLDLSAETRNWNGSSTINLHLMPGGQTIYGALFFNFENVIAGSGNDQINGTDGANRLEGRDGNDALNGGDGNDKLYGGAGDDVLRDGSAQIYDEYGTDELYGGAGNDTIQVNYSSAGEIYDGGDDIDTLDLSGEDFTYTINLTTSEFIAYEAYFRNFENVIGSADNDVITGSDARNVLDGGFGVDTINAGGGDDEIIDQDSEGGQPGDSDVIDAGSGNDIVRVRSIGFDTYNGGAGDSDTLDVSGRSEGGIWNLSLAAFSNGGQTFRGFENFIGTALSDTVTGSGAANIIDGGAGFDNINGGGGNDIITDADFGGDIIDGGEGDDTIIITGFWMPNTTNKYYGGAGVDTLDMRGGADNYGGAFSLDPRGFELAWAAYFGVRELSRRFCGTNIQGSDYDNIIDGGDGSDTIEAKYGDDTLRDGDAFADYIAGEAGNDTFEITRATDGDFYDGGPGATFVDILDLSGITDRGFDFARQLKLDGTGSVTVRNFEKVIGTGFADWVVGAETNETIVGGGGGDNLFGNGGDDVLEGGAGADNLDGWDRQQYGQL